jgi:hypothetical protein
MNQTDFRLLHDDSRGRKVYRAWHQSYKCGGIKHCEYTHPDILRTCPAYDKVELAHINDLRQASSQLHSESTVFERLKSYTESVYNGFMSRWDKEAGPCTFPNTNERVCQNQDPVCFRRSGVGILYTCARHMLSLVRCNTLGVLSTVTLNPGIQQCHSQQPPHGSI